MTDHPQARGENLDPQDTKWFYDASITGQSTELVCFRLDEPKELACVRRLGADADAVQALPLGSFLSWNRLSREKLAGKVF